MKQNKLIITDNTLDNETASELLGIVSTLRRSVLNYHKQSQEELDFYKRRTKCRKS